MLSACLHHNRRALCSLTLASRRSFSLAHYRKRELLLGTESSSSPSNQLRIYPCQCRSDKLRSLQGTASRVPSCCTPIAPRSLALSFRRPYNGKAQCLKFTKSPVQCNARRRSICPVNRLRPNIRPAASHKDSKCSTPTLCRRCRSIRVLRHRKSSKPRLECPQNRPSSCRSIWSCSITLWMPISSLVRKAVAQPSPSSVSSARRCFRKRERLLVTLLQLTLSRTLRRTMIGRHLLHAIATAHQISCQIKIVSLTSTHAGTLSKTRRPKMQCQKLLIKIGTLFRLQQLRTMNC